MPSHGAVRLSRLIMPFTLCSSHVLIIIETCFIQILTESEQMRKEAYDIGPKAELEHWKKRLAKFDSLTACVKDPQCRMVVSLLVASKSKVLKVCQQPSTEIAQPSLHLPIRNGGNWTCPSLISPMKPRTMSSSSTHWRSTVSLSTSVTQ